MKRVVTIKIMTGINSFLSSVFVFFFSSFLRFSYFVRVQRLSSCALSAAK